MKLKTAMLGVAVATALAGSGHAQNIIIDSAYDSKVGDTSGTDAFGNPWTWNLTSGPAGPDSPGKNYNAWGTPGLGDGTAVYGDVTDAVDFEISFVFNKPKNVGINETPSPFAGGYNEWTRFDACDKNGNNCVEWSPVFPDAPNAHEVDFFAPTGDKLVAGDEYFVNVVFTTKKFGTAADTPIPGFSAAFSSATIPEASTWAMLGIGFAGIGLVGLTRRRKGSRYAL